MNGPYHCSILVEDLDAALPRFEAFLGIAFREDDSRALTPHPEGGLALATAAPVRFAFSVGGYPYVELIEAQDEGVFDRAGGLGVHHVGAWVEDLDEVGARHARQGLDTIARFVDPDEVERVAYAGDAEVTVERINARLRPDYEIWLAGGEPRPANLGARGESYHLAYLVEDLEAGMDRYEEILGVEFRPPMKRPMIEGVGPDLADPSGERIEVEFTYSLGDRQPYVELMQMRDSGPVFGRDIGAGFHHIGIWSPAPEDARRIQQEAGATVEARFFSEGGVERVSFASLDGVRGEFVNEAIRPTTEEWLPRGARRTWR